MYIYMYICKISIKSDLYQMRNRSFKFSPNWLSNDMTSQILLDAQVFCPANYAHLVIFINLYSSETRRDIERYCILLSIKWSFT